MDKLFKAVESGIKLGIALCDSCGKVIARKAPGDWRSPRRWREGGGLHVREASWTAVALCRFYGKEFIFQFVKMQARQLLHPAQS